MQDPLLHRFDVNDVGIGIFSYLPDGENYLERKDHARQRREKTQSRRDVNKEQWKGHHHGPQTSQHQPYHHRHNSDTFAGRPGQIAGIHSKHLLNLAFHFHQLLDTLLYRWMGHKKPGHLLTGERSNYEHIRL